MTRSPYATHWQLDPTVTFLNHGSFGACPTVVLEAQRAIRDRMEAEPVRFFLRELQDQLDTARDALAAFIGARSDDLAFVPNATTGVNTVLRSLRFAPGDEVLTTNHVYNACKNAAKRIVEQQGASLVIAPVPFPLASPDEVTAAILAHVTPRTRLCLLDHVTSATGIVFPATAIVSALSERGIDTLVDGAHAPGMLDLDVSAINAAYYTGNCHKWLCAPKGAAFLWVRADRQAAILPLVTSHGAGILSQPGGRSRYQLELDYVGTDDPSAYLAVPHAIRFLGALLPGGWPELRATNRALCLAARQRLCHALAIEAPCPAEMISTLAALPLPDGTPCTTHFDALQDVLYFEHRIEVPVMLWPASPKRLVRVSAQLYNTLDDYARLATALSHELNAPRSS